MVSTVYVAKRIRTLDAARPLAEAIATRGGKVLAVGPLAEVLALAGPGAKRVELPDATLVPGLTDAHGHLLSFGRSLAILQLKSASSVEELVGRAKAATEESYQGDWLVGRGWDQNDWSASHGDFPHREALDAAFPNTPVFFTRVDGHAVWLNSEGLRRAGITRATRDPPGGRIVRDARGEPTGVLVDNAADLASTKLPAMTDAQRQQRLQRALKQCASVGLTSVHDAGMDLATFRQLQLWDAGGVLPLRVYAMADGQGDDAQTYLEQGPFQGRNLTLRAVKLLSDGALGSRGAALEAPYSDDPTQTGLLLLTPEQLGAKADAFSARGFQVAIHAIGDRANALCLDVLSRVAHAHPGSRPRVEHAQVIRPQDLPRFAQEGIIASMQPTHATSDMKWAEARLGAERLEGAYAWKTLLDSGAHLAFGSDFPIEDPQPLLGLYAARTRQDLHGLPKGGWRPQERLSGEQALEAFTTGAAYAAFAEGERGKLAVGMDADFVALTVDPVEAPPPALLEGKVLLTVVGGVEVFRGP